jgi:hypothetical protein
MKKFLIGMAIFLGGVILVAAGWAAAAFFQRQALPRFTLEQHISADGTFMESTLSAGSQRYVETAFEFDLLPAADFSFPKRLGRVDELEINSVPQNDDYITLSGFMYPSEVFRSESAPALSLQTLPVDQVRLQDTSRGKRIDVTSADPAMTAELRQILQAPAQPVFSQSPVQGLLKLYADPLRGLVYPLSFHIDAGSTVTLFLPRDEHSGYPAGPLLTQWILAQ